MDRTPPRNRRNRRSRHNSHNHNDTLLPSYNRNVHSPDESDSDDRWSTAANYSPVLGNNGALINNNNAASNVPTNSPITTPFDLDSTMPRHHATVPIPHLSITALPHTPAGTVYLFPTSHIHATIIVSQHSTPTEAVIPNSLTPNEIIRQVIGGNERGGWVVRIVADDQGVMYGGLGIRGVYGGYGQGGGGVRLMPEALDGDLPIGGWVAEGDWVRLEIMREVDTVGWGSRERARGTGRGGEGSSRGAGFL
ncbi:MAG: hypothetical protein M1839_000142 [Geoglossum umbratile]|nr:MAG: hypothetical protein M1839_000142 [Geoglossum umbratile]